MKTTPGLFTAGGVVAVILWSSSTCVCGSLIPKLGVFTTAGAVYLLSGLFATLTLAFSSGLKEFRRISSKRLLFCGVPFVGYIVLFYLAIGMAANGRQLIEIGLVNYLWPAFSLLLSVPLQKNKASLLLPAGIVASVGGIFMAGFAFNGGLGAFAFVSDIQRAPLPYLLAFLGAILWGLYCNSTRILEAEACSADLAAFMLLSGLILGPLAFVFHEAPQWGVQTCELLAATALLPGFLACLLWDAAARRGDFIFVSAFAYLSPAIATVMTGLLFKVPLTLGVWTACLLAVVGAAICHVSVKKPGNA